MREALDPHVGGQAMAERCKDPQFLLDFAVSQLRAESIERGEIDLGGIKFRRLGFNGHDITRIDRQHRLLLARTVDSPRTEAIGDAADMPPMEAIAGRPVEARRCFNVAVVLAGA
jgi:hypothetical protein